MPLLSREQFVDTCTKAILYTRDKIEIRNQLSGYKKYHLEIKENKYFFSNVRQPMGKIGPHEYMYRHDYIKHVGLGNCEELAHFLLVEIASEIERRGALARIRVVSSLREDHVYLEIRIRLYGERDYSLWEVDAWDPRVIDISTRPDGTIKNRESLHYGYSVDIKNSVYSDQIDYRHRFHFFNDIPKPVPGRPSREATPESEMLGKHSLLYSDYTIDESMEEGKMDPSGELHYLQKVSSWQR